MDDFAQDSSDDEVVSSDDEVERFGRRLPRTRYTTVDDDNDDHEAYAARSSKRRREEAIYGVFLEEQDEDEAQLDRRRRKRNKPLFKDTSAALQAPLFVKGDVLVQQDDEPEKEKETEETNQEQSTQTSTHTEKQPPTEEELARQAQRQQANQKFLDLLNRAKRNRKRPPTSQTTRDEQPAPPNETSESAARNVPVTATSIDNNNDAKMPALGLGHGLGLGLGLQTPMAAPTPTPAKKDPNLGTWEKHTKGIGMKLLAKMGYKGSGGLGSKRRQAEQKTGISRALQVKVRPANLGLGYGGFKEASTLKVNRQLEAQVRGEVQPPENPNVSATTKPLESAYETEMPKAPDSALPTTDELLKDSSWQKGAREAKRKREKQKEKFIPYDQILEAKKQQQQQQTHTKVVDLRGPQSATTTTTITTTTGSEMPPLGPPALGEELLHNVSLLLNARESKLYSHSQFASAAEQKLHSLQAEVDDVERQKALVDERCKKMEQATEILETYQAQVEKGVFQNNIGQQNGGQTQFEAAIVMIQDMSRVFSVEDRKALKFDTTVAPVLLGDALQGTMKRWNPLRRGNDIAGAVSLVASIVQFPLTMDKESAMSLRRNLFLKYVLPKIQKAYESAHWDAMEQTDVGIEFYEKLMETVKENFESFSPEGDSEGSPEMTETVRRTIIFEVVHPKLERALSSWKPMLDQKLRLQFPLHEWILPWVPFMDHPGILPTFMSQCKRRVESAVSFLSRKIPDDNERFLTSFSTVLRPWAQAFKSSSVHDITGKYALKHVAACVENIGGENSVQRLPYEMYEGGLMSLVDFLALVEYGVLLHVVKPAYESATSEASNPKQLATTYLERKYDFKSLLQRYPLSNKAVETDDMIPRCFLTVLRMVDAVNHKDTASLARLEPLSGPILFTSIQTRRIRTRKKDAQIEMLRMETGEKDKLATRTRAHFLRQSENKATFREVVEEFCLQESIPFTPRTTGAKTHVDGKQVFLLGEIPVYLDSDVIFAYEGDHRWEPTSLESLLQRVRAS